MTIRPSKKGKTSGASIASRFGAEAKRLNISTTAVREQYAREAFFRRLSHSTWRDQFILKGSVLLVAVLGRHHRPTIDADFVVLQPLDAAGLRKAIGSIISIPADDQVEFDPQTIRISQMQENARVVGQSVEVRGKLGKGEIVFRADVGFTDVITPRPVEVTFPGIMSEPITVLGSTIVTVIAEKYDAMVDRGIANTRAKDFYDLALIARTRDISGSELIESIRSTFSNRGRALPSGWAPVLDTLSGNEDHQRRWKSFLRQNSLEDFGTLESAIRDIHSLMSEPLGHVEQRRAFKKRWRPNIGWN